MSVRIADGKVWIEGSGLVEDAEPLLAALLEDRAIPVDLGGCGRLHTAVVQILIALRPQIVGMPADSFYGAHLAPLLGGAR